MAGCNKPQLYLTTIVLTVVFLTANQAVEGRRKGICDRTAYPKLCRPLVKGSNPRVATFSNICALQTKTRRAIANAEKNKKGNKQVTICHEKLRDADFNLKKAKYMLNKRHNKMLRIFLTRAVSDFGVCVNTFVDSHQVNTVQNAADELRKTGTNCLFISTLIRRSNHRRRNQRSNRRRKRSN
ncbi:F87 protein [Hirschfeldia incana]|nr:F87 protein [Hirschfeldia incana]